MRSFKESELECTKNPSKKTQILTHVKIELCPAGRLTLGIARLTALLMVPPHPVTSTPAARAAPVRARHLVRRRIRAARASL